VYAYPSEIDAWRAGRRVAAEPVPAARPWWQPVAVGFTTLLFLVLVGNGVRPTVASAQQPEDSKTARQIWQTQPNQALPSPSPVSPDGRHLAFVDWNTGDLWVRDLSSGTNRRLTSYGTLPQWWEYVDSAVLSQDGSEIAYSWSIDKHLSTELRVIPISGGTPRTIRRGEPRDYVTPFGWTPDKKWVLISHNPPDNTTQLAMLSIRDGSLRPLKSFGWQDVNASLSPDGKWVAYDAHASDKTLSHDIFVLAIDGSQERAVVQNPADDTLPVWTPDGKRILFLSDRTGQPSLWSVPVNEGKAGNPELVKPDIGRIAWMEMSRDGTLYYNVGGVVARFSKSNIYMAELGLGQTVSKAPALAVDSFVNSNNGGVISPDGEYLGYRSMRTGSKPTLVVKTIKTGEERIVPLKPPLQDSVGLRSWFPDGKSVLVGFRGPDEPGVEFYRVELETGKAELLHRTGSPIRSFQLSPNGKFIVYTENNPETAPAITTRLVRFDLDTRRETELKKDEWYMGVGISPDSKQISYRVSVTPGPASFLAVMPAAGGAAREIYRASPWQNSSPDQVWTPDQRYIIFARQESGGAGTSTALWKVPVAGGAAEKIGIAMNARLAFSMPADGKRIFLSATEEGPNEVWALENFLPKDVALNRSRN
jgi:Tol biopolymer transport system component